MADFWSEEREENLIRLLEEQPVLYDVGSKGYSNRDSKKKACCNIAVAFGVSSVSVQLVTISRMRHLLSWLRQLLEIGPDT